MQMHIFDHTADKLIEFVDNNNKEFLTFPLNKSFSAKWLSLSDHYYKYIYSAQEKWCNWPNHLQVNLIPCLLDSRKSSCKNLLEITKSISLKHGASFFCSRNNNPGNLIYPEPWQVFCLVLTNKTRYVFQSVSMEYKHVASCDSFTASFCKSCLHFSKTMFMILPWHCNPKRLW